MNSWTCHKGINRKGPEHKSAHSRDRDSNLNQVWGMVNSHLLGHLYSLKELLRNPESVTLPPVRVVTVALEMRARPGSRPWWPSGLAGREASRKLPVRVMKSDPSPPRLGMRMSVWGGEPPCPDLTPPPASQCGREGPHLPAASIAAGLAVALPLLEGSGSQSGPPCSDAAGRQTQDRQ